MRKRVVLALTGAMLALGAAPAAAGPAWGPPGWPNQPIDGGHPPEARLILAQASSGGAALTAASTLSSIKTLDLGAASLTTKQADIATDAHMWAVAVNINNRNLKAHLNNVEVLKLDIAKQAEYANGVIPQMNAYKARCEGHVFNRETEMAEYNACMAELARLTPFKTKVDDWAREIETFRAALVKKEGEINAAAASLNQMESSLAARFKDNDAAGRQYLAERRVLEMQYAALKKGQGGCAEALRQHLDPETIKEACGMLFGGGELHDVVLVQVPGLPAPVWKPFNNNDPRWKIDDDPRRNPSHYGK